MGGSIHRLEILLIGIIVLIAGSLVAALMLLRPPAQSGYTMATAVPVATAADSEPSQPDMATPVPATPEAPIKLPHTSLLVLPTGTGNALVAIRPFTLLALSGIGLALVGRQLVRRRRMAYTGQSVSMLFATADAATRASNLRVLRELQTQGELPPELAAAAGLSVPQRWRLPKLKRPEFKLPLIKLPALAKRLPQRTYQLDLTPTPLVTSQDSASTPLHDTAAEHPLTHQEPSATTRTPNNLTPIAEQDFALSLRPMVAEREPFPKSTTLDEIDAAPQFILPNSLDDPEAMTAQEDVLARSDSPAEADTYMPDWSRDDYALAVASALAEIWRIETLVSPVVGIETNIGGRSNQVIAVIDALPDEEERLISVPDCLQERYPAWHVQWKQVRQNTAMLLVNMQGTGELPAVGGPLIAPVLQHGRGTAHTRYYPFSTWRHLGLYGAEAHGCLHALLAAILYMQPPSSVALSILDKEQISPLYRNTPHFLAIPDDMPVAIDLLNRSLRRGDVANTSVRSLLLVIVEPDVDTLMQLTPFLTRLRQQPDAPIHLVLVQERLLTTGRELYAMLPALVTASGEGPVSWLPGQVTEWPKRGSARLVGRGMRTDGRPITLTESEAAEQLAPLRYTVEGLPLTSWEIVAASPPPSHLPVQAIASAGHLAQFDRCITPEEQLFATNPVTESGIKAPEEAHNHVAPAIESAQILTLDSGASERIPTIPEATTPQALGSTDEPTGLAEEPVRRESEPLGSPTVTASGLQAQASILDDVLRRLDHALTAPSPSRAPAGLSTTLPALALSNLEEPENGWPCGPKPLGRAGLASLLAALIDDPEIMQAKQADQIGLTKKRLQALGLRLKLFPEAQARMLAELLIVWFDQASVLVMPLKTKEHPLNQPRALERTDLDWIRERLNATPMPAQDAVRAAWATTAGSGANL